MQRVRILGAGLAGCALAWELRRRGLEVEVWESARRSCASLVAGGLLNPVLGMRLSRAWRADTHLPEAVRWFGALGTELGRPWFHPLPIVRLFKRPEQREFWREKRGLAAVAPWAVREIAEGEKLPGIARHLGGFVVEGGGWVDVRGAVEAMRGKLAAEGILLEREAAVVPDAEAGVVTVCCRGHADAAAWPEIGWKPAHGDVLDVALPGLPEDRIVIESCFLVPLGGGVFRTGSTYRWAFDNDAPTAAGREEILDRLERLLGVRPEVLEHRAAVRSIVKGRTPVMGRHPRREDLWIFNGLGSTGAMRAPALVGHLADVLAGTRGVDAEMDVGRWMAVEGE
jgi:glycine oxidase